MNGNAYAAFSKYYDAMMHDVDYTAWSAYLCGLLSERRVQTVADLACGTGNITIPLAEHGFRVVGIDSSQSMLNVAQQKAQSKGLAIPFVCQSMTQLSLHKPVDALTVCCDGVNYLTSLRDARAFFLAAYAALADGGVLLFDVSSEYKLEHVLGTNTFTEVTDAYAYIWENAFDSKSRLCCMDVCFFVKNGARYERFSEQHIQRAYTVDELVQLGEEAGFSKVSAYEAFSLHAPSPHSERIQFVMGKE